MKQLLATLLVFLAALAVTEPNAAEARQFKKPVYYKVGPTGALPWSVVSADFNGDGNLDLAVYGCGAIFKFSFGSRR